MAKHNPPTFPEPRGISQEVWVAACVAIIIFTALVATLVPSFTTNIKQAITQPTPSASQKTVAAHPITDVLYSRLKTAAEPYAQSVTYGQEHVGMLVQVNNLPGAMMCSNTQAPGSSTWLGLTGGLITNVDRYGREVDWMAPRNPSYFRIEKPVTYLFYSSMDPTCRS
jgi:hypothetical protein